MEEKDYLMPCPFCGNRGIVLDTYKGRYKCDSSYCGAEGPCLNERVQEVDSASYRWAKDKWNRRI